VTEPTGPIASIALNPARATIPIGWLEPYEAEAYNASGEDIGEVTGATTFAIDTPGTCSVNRCGSAIRGTYTVTGTDGPFVATAELDVGACRTGACG
jgi:hypothetical protein